MNNNDVKLSRWMRLFFCKKSYDCILLYNAISLVLMSPQTLLKFIIFLFATYSTPTTFYLTLTSLPLSCIIWKIVSHFFYRETFYIESSSIFFDVLYYFVCHGMFDQQQNTC